jgi:enoyl-[acyl-carrier protein] reductase I
MNLLKGKKLLICSPANDRSIAWGVAKKAREEGAEIGLTYGVKSSEGKVRELAGGIGAELFGQYDVQDDASVGAVFAAVEKKWGSIDGILHAIAHSDPEQLRGRYADTTRDNFKNTMDISVFSLTDMARRAAPLMKNGGSILTLTYLGGERAVPNYNAMGVAKAALDASVRYLASDLGRDGIRVNAISAGPILTRSASGVGGFRSMLKLNAEMTPLRRNLTLEDIGGAAAYFFSDLSAGITGETHHVDCGYSTVGMLPNELKDALVRGLEAAAE